MRSPTTENYLKALLSLGSAATGEAAGAVTITDLSAALEVSKPSASSMAKALAADGLVHYERYRPVSLTPSGRKAAAQVVRKHRLTEMYLVERMGFGWDEVHAVAEQIEHVNAPAFFARMDELLGHPTVDPHGSPIPTAEGIITRPSYRSLAETRVGEKVKLRAVHAETDNLLALLTRKGIALGTAFEVCSVEPFDGSIEVSYVGDGVQRTEVLTRDVGRCLLVD